MKQILDDPDEDIENKDWAVSEMQMLADRGVPQAWYMLGKLYWDGGVLIPDSALVAEAFESAAWAGMAPAQCALGELLLSDDLEVCNSELGMEWLECAWQNGSLRAGYRLAKEYLCGKNIAKDAAQGLKCLIECADAGHPGAQYLLGKLYLTGQEVPRDVERAEYWLSQAETRDKLRTAIQENRGPAVNFKGDYTVGEWMWLWFETYSKPNLRPSTVDNYTNYNRTKEGGRVKRWEDMEDLSLSNRVIRGIHMVLRQALQQAVNERIINHNPCDNCRIPKLEKTERKIIPPEQIGAYLQCAKERGVLPMFYLELTTGLRRGELLALLWTDLDVKKRTITENKSVSRIDGELVVSEPKTQNSVRTVVIPQQAVDLLVEDRKNHPDSPYLFPSPRTGRMWSPDAIGRLHKTLLKEAGITESVPFHGLRHIFATTALLNGVDVKTVSSMLGHYSAGFTLDTYTHVTTQMQQAAADKMGGFMENALPGEGAPEPEPPKEGGGKIIPFERVG